MGRRAAREYAFQLLYQVDMRMGDEDIILQNFFEENDLKKGQIDYIKKVIIEIQKSINNIDSLIEENSIDWKLNRISKVVLAILRLSIFEMMEMPDIPAEVSINEAIELAKKYDSEKAGAFINGLLGAVKNQLSK